MYVKKLRHLFKAALLFLRELETLLFEFLNAFWRFWAVLSRDSAGVPS